MVRILRKVIVIANGTIKEVGGSSMSKEETVDVATTMDGACDGAPDQQR